MIMTDAQLEKYAEVLLWGLHTARKGKYVTGDAILLRYALPALKLAEILHARLLDQGLNPIPRMGLTATMERNFYHKANHDQLVFQPAGERDFFGNIQGNIVIHAPESLTHLSDVDPKKIGEVLIARKPLRQILDKREEEGLFGWTLCTFPTPELAQKAELSLQDYTAQIIKACYLDYDDPVSEWKTIYQKAAHIKEWLNSLDVGHFHIQSEKIDLRITPGAQRQWIGISGHNIPSFELFISPDWRGTEGRFFADQPSYRSGNYARGVSLTFKNGAAVEVSAETGEDFVLKQLAIDAGARRVGEFSLTDTRFSRIDTFMADTLFDENYGGTYGNCHIALGSSYSDTYKGNPAELSSNRKEELGFNDSALHWDLVNTEEKQVRAHLKSGHDIILYESGQFRY